MPDNEGPKTGHQVGEEDGGELSAIDLLQDGHAHLLDLAAEALQQLRRTGNGSRDLGIARSETGHHQPPYAERLAGHGLAWRSAWEVAEEIEKGRLIEVLPKFAVPGSDIYAVYPDRKFLPAKVRLFIDFMKKTFGDPPYWERNGK